MPLKLKGTLGIQSHENFIFRTPQLWAYLVLNFNSTSFRPLSVFGVLPTSQALQFDMSANSARPSGLFAPQYIHGVYIPAGLIVVGTFIVKREWLPYAVVIAVILGAWKVYNNRKTHHSKDILDFELKLHAGIRKVLRPNEFQEFELKEKTIISHNTAMYACAISKIVKFNVFTVLQLPLLAT